MLPASPAWLWALFGAALAAAAVLLWHTWARVQNAEHPPAFAPAPVDRPESGREDRALSLAGSGSNLPLSRRLLDAFVAARPQSAVRLYDSIGSGGGVRAVRDGAVDVGLVSRELNSSERGDDIVWLPYAKTSVVLIAHPGVFSPGLTPAAILDLFSGRKTTFADGTRAVVLLREPGDSSHDALERVWPEFGAACRASYAKRRLEVVFSDRVLLQKVAETPGAMGLSDRGQVGLAAPGLQSLIVGAGGDGAPAEKVLAFVVSNPPPEPVREFLKFVFLGEGQRVIAEAGYAPLPPREKPWE
jgi:phosphate transport system substrate-binding protein